MSARHEIKARNARAVLDMKCPVCGSVLLTSNELEGCWIPMHFRCVKCAHCWRIDGTARSCNIVGQQSPKNWDPKLEWG